MPHQLIAWAAAASFFGTMPESSVASDQSVGKDIAVVGGQLDSVTHRKVPYADLNLAYGYAQRELDRRIHNAAYDICGPALGYWRGEVSARYCVEEAVESTDDQVMLAIDSAKRSGIGVLNVPPFTIWMIIDEP